MKIKRIINRMGLAAFVTLLAISLKTAQASNLDDAFERGMDGDICRHAYKDAVEALGSKDAVFNDILSFTIFADGGGIIEQAQFKKLIGCVVREGEFNIPVKMNEKDGGLRRAFLGHAPQMEEGELAILVELKSDPGFVSRGQYAAGEFNTSHVVHVRYYKQGVNDPESFYDSYCVKGFVVPANGESQLQMMTRALTQCLQRPYNFTSR